MSSLFVRKRGNIYNVVVEFKDARGKIKQKSIDKFKNIEDANRRKKELLQDAIFIKNNDISTFVDITIRAATGP